MISYRYTGAGPFKLNYLSDASLRRLKDAGREPDPASFASHVEANNWPSRHLVGKVVMIGKGGSVIHSFYRVVEPSTNHLTNILS